MVYQLYEDFYSKAFPALFIHIFQIRSHMAFFRLWDLRLNRSQEIYFFRYAKFIY